MKVLDRGQQQDDERYLRDGLAFVCNGAELGEKWTRIHRSDCRFLHHSRTGVTASYKKYCARGLNDLVSAVTKELGFTPVACHFCREAGRVEIG